MAVDLNMIGKISKKYSLNLRISAVMNIFLRDLKNKNEKW